MWAFCFAPTFVPAQIWPER